MKKTEYIVTLMPYWSRRVWEDENGWFITVKGERCEIQKNHFALKHKPVQRVATKEDGS